MAKRSRSGGRSKALLDKGVRFRLLVDSVIDYAIFMLDTEGRVVTWNAGAERIKGYRAEEIRGRHYSCFYPEEALRAGTPAHLLKVAAAEGRCEDEGWRLRKDGSRFWANVVITAVRDGAGRLRGFSKVTRDLTERRRTQEALDEKTRALEAAQEALVRRERLAILGQLAGGLSHELRNPLGVVKNSVYYLRMVFPDDEPARKHLAIIEREVETANRIVTALLDFARVSVPRRVPSDLNAMVRARLDREAVPHGVTVAATLAEDLPPVALDPEQIVLALGNLILNALQAMPSGGALTVETSWTARAVLIGVADTGVGIAPEHLDKIFEPLFTTKARGIGLGLAVVKRLLEANGGQITVESTLGQGSRFWCAFRAPPRPPRRFHAGARRPGPRWPARRPLGASHGRRDADSRPAQHGRDPRRTRRVAWRLPVLSFGERQPTTSVAISLARARPAPGGRESVRPRAQSFGGGAPGGRGQGTRDVRAAEPPEGEGFSRDSGRRSGF